MKYLALAALCILAVLRPDHVEPQTGDLVTQGRQALDGDRPEEAITLFEKAVAAEPNNPAALAWLGSAQVRTAPRVGGMEAAGWVKRGFDTLDEAVERFPDAFIVYVVRGVTAALTASVSIRYVPSSAQSTSTGVAPALETASAVAMNVFAGRMHSAP